MFKTRPANITTAAVSISCLCLIVLQKKYTRQCLIVEKNSAYTSILEQLLWDSIGLNGVLLFMKWLIINILFQADEERKITLSSAMRYRSHDNCCKQVSGSLKCVVTVLNISNWKYAHLRNISVRGPSVCFSTRCSKEVISLKWPLKHWNECTL